LALSEIDKNLLDRCLSRRPGSWEDFVDRFMGLVTHVVNHTAQARSIKLSPGDRDDLCGDVFLAVIKDDFALLRRFRGQCSLATYLTVVARRVAVRELLQKKTLGRLSLGAVREPEANGHHEQRINDRDQVEKLLGELNPDDARIVRLFHLEGRSYHEISLAVGVPENSIGPTLTRVREKMRQAGA
jgi:RNA polymerase sigma-70 factor (ECF subfamily)